jgi:hydroxypyruvate isomerase
MPKFAANLTMLFNEVDFMDRFDAAAKAGFRGVEYLFPYAYDKNQLAEKLKSLKLIQVLHNLPAGDWNAGDRGNACQPARIGEFQDGVGKAIDFAKTLGCQQVNCLAGITPKDAKPDQLRKTFVENLRFAAGKLKAAGIRLLIEPINTYDIPGFYLSRSSQALEIMDEVGSDNLFLQYDVYHMQRMEGELATNLKKHLARIRHIQIADNPGRNEPGTGEINYTFLFKHIDQIGYDGWIGCEYKPAAATAAGLGWAKAYLSQK